MSRGGRRSLLVLGSSAIGLGLVSIVVGILGIASAGGKQTAAVGTTPSPTVAGSPSATPTVSTPTATATVPTPTAAPAPVPDLTALVGRCPSIPAGTVPAFLRFNGHFSSGTATDPRTEMKTFVILAGLDASPLGRTAPFSFTGILLPQGAHPPVGRVRAIDGLGTVQLWFASDRSGEHKGIRTFHDGRWTMKTDDDADALTIQLSANEIRFHWSGLQQGEGFAFASAGAGGCAGLGVDAVRAPGG